MSLDPPLIRLLHASPKLPLTSQHLPHAWAMGLGRYHVVRVLQQIVIILEVGYASDGAVIFLMFAETKNYLICTFLLIEG